MTTTSAVRQLAALAVYRVEQRRAQRAAPYTQPIVEWGEKNFYIPETASPIVLERHQKAVLRYCLAADALGHFRFRTIVYSTPKKEGKTTIAGMVTQWAMETWGRYELALCVGNDADQAKERAFAAMKQSIELTPGYRRPQRMLPDRWRVLDAEATCLTTGSKVKAIATDYQGEAGANPSITVYTELWGFIHEAARRFWAEMAPSPTRTNSIRWVETYAGYEGESELLWGLYESTVKNGRQLTAGELGDPGCFEESPNPDDLVPCWVNEAAGTFAYWDSGTQARRMPWKQGTSGDAYYANEAATQTPSQMIRLHSNEWVGAESEFCPIELWDACYDPLPLVPGERTPLVVSLDAGVSDDNFGLVVVSRDPKRPDGVAERLCKLWKAPQGGKIDFAGPEEFLATLCGFQRGVKADGTPAWVRVPGAGYNVVQVAYDPYQLHDFATRLTKDGVAWFREFSQGQERLEADKLLLDLIIQRRIRHNGDQDLREHIQNAKAKQGKDEDTRLRMIKKSEGRKIDLAVALSTAARECLRLNL